jgi:hypothetical protein
MTFRFKHLSQTQLGELFGVTSHTVGKWLKNLGLRDEAGSPTKKAHDGRFCKQTIAGDKGSLWVWESVNTVAALKDAGHPILLNPPQSLVSPAILNGPFTVQSMAESICVIANGDGSDCIRVNNPMTAEVVARILNLAHEKGVIDRMCQAQRLMQMPLVIQAEIDSVVTPYLSN